MRRFLGTRSFPHYPSQIAPNPFYQGYSTMIAQNCMIPPAQTQAQVQAQVQTGALPMLIGNASGHRTTICGVSVDH